MENIGVRIQDWIQLAEDGIQWWPPVNTVMKFWIP
jgi:hypothetical protein